MARLMATLTIHERCCCAKHEILILIAFLLTGIGMMLLIFLVTCIHSYLPYCEGIQYYQETSPSRLMSKTAYTAVMTLVTFQTYPPTLHAPHSGSPLWRRYGLFKS